MKTCYNSRNCQYGSCDKANTCAYRDSMCEYDVCPKIIENWETLIDVMQGARLPESKQEEVK